MFKRLTTRIVLSQLLVIGVAMGLLIFVLLSLVQSYFTQAAADSLLVQARLTAQALAAPITQAAPNAQSAPNAAAANIAQSQLPSAANSIQSSQMPAQAISQNLTANSATATRIRLSLDLETRVRLLDRSGTALSDSTGEDLNRDLSSLPGVSQALAGGESSAAEGELVLAAVPLHKGSAVAGAILLSQPLRDVNIVMADLRLRLLVSAGIALVFAALVGALLARGIARPVRELTHAADKLSSGDFSHPLDVSSSDELGDLARAFQRMRRDLQHMLQARTDLVANVSHELRTPLTAIKGLVETLRDGAVDDPAVRDAFLASIEQQADRLTRLVNDLLTLSRADSDAIALQKRPTDIAALAHTCAGQLAPKAAAAQVSIDVLGTNAQVQADADRIQQVLVNLLDNAIRFAPRASTVTVLIAQIPGFAKVSVSDHGPGLTPAEQARVFERFYRGDRSRTRQGDRDSGAGLGLSIAEVLVRAHGGEIGIDSVAEQGATVWFTLPL